MTPDEIKAQLDIADAEIRLADNGAFYWVNLTRERDGHRYTTTTTIPLEASPAQIDAARKTLATWWADTINDQLSPNDTR